MKHGLPLESLVDLFETVLAGMPTTMERDAIRQLASHWLLVRQWNARTNLTAISDDEDAAWLHYRDSLEALAVLPEGPVVDLGSGAGFPGFPIGVAQPERQVALLEPRRKRVSFLETAVARIRTANIQVIHGRSSDTPAQKFPAAVTRATFSDPEQLQSCLDWLEPGGILVAFRAEPIADLGHSKTHSYALRGEARILQVIENL